MGPAPSLSHRATVPPSHCPTVPLLSLLMSTLVALALVILIFRATPAIVKRIASGGLDTESKAHLDDLEHRLQETEERLRGLAAATDGRFVDLEERQDVTDRVLQQVREDRALPEG